MTEDIECTDDYAVGYRAGWKDATTNTTNRIEALEAARAADLQVCADQLEQNTTTMNAAADRIEALETALREITTVLDFANGGKLVEAAAEKANGIARAAIALEQTNAAD